MSTVIDSSGLTRDRLDQILADYNALYQSIFGTDISIGPSTDDGQWLGAISEIVSKLGQLLESVYLSRSVSGATGASLSRLVMLNGITRNPASASTADVVFTGTPGTVIPAGSLIDTPDTPPAHFATNADVTIGASGTIPGTVTATTVGPVFADTGDISVIKTPISGWASVTNVAPVNLGSLVETDAALRRRRLPSVALQSRGIIDGMKAALANIQGVSEAVVFENKTGAPIARPPSADLPPNSMQVVVVGGLDAAIGAAIWAKASIGVTLVGKTSVTVVDTQGIGQLIKYDRPTPVAIFVTVFLSAQASVIITDAFKLAIRQSIVDLGNSLDKIGAIVSRAPMFGPVYALTAGTLIRGLSVSIGTTPGSVSTADILVPFDGIAFWDIGNINVVVNILP